MSVPRDPQLEREQEWKRRIIEHLGPQRMSLHTGKDINMMARALKDLDVSWLDSPAVRIARTALAARLESDAGEGT